MLLSVSLLILTIGTVVIEKNTRPQNTADSLVPVKDIRKPGLNLQNKK